MFAIKLKTNLFLLFVVVLLNNCSNYNCCEKNQYEIIELPEYYSGKGALVNQPLFPPSKKVNWYIPTKEEANKAEKILSEGLFKYLSKTNDIKLDSDDSTFYKDILTNWYRHYSGLIYSNEEKIIFITLFNYKSSIGKHLFADWECKDHFIFNSDTGDHEYFKYCFGFYINITKECFYEDEIMDTNKIDYIIN